MLSDHLSSVAAKKSNPLELRDQKKEGKANHHLNNLFHESMLQKRLSGGIGDKVAAPASHISFTKELGRAFMTPIDSSV